VLKLGTDKGITGWGCAAPDLEAKGETPESIIQNIENVAIGLLKRESLFQMARITHQLKQLFIVVV
jgi:hypothetical protein